MSRASLVSVRRFWIGFTPFRFAWIARAADSGARYQADANSATRWGEALLRSKWDSGWDSIQSIWIYAAIESMAEWVGRILSILNGCRWDSSTPFRVCLGCRCTSRLDDLRAIRVRCSTSTGRALSIVSVLRFTTSNASRSTRGIAFEMVTFGRGAAKSLPPRSCTSALILARKCSPTRPCWSRNSCCQTRSSYSSRSFPLLWFCPVSLWFRMQIPFCFTWNRGFIGCYISGIFVNVGTFEG